MISPNLFSEVEVIISEGEDIAGEPIRVTESIVIKGLFAHGSTATDFGVDRDIINSQATFITFENFPESSLYLLADGIKYSISGKPQKWVAPSNFKLRTGTVVNLVRSENG